LPKNLKFPFKLAPQESIDVKVALIAETLGLFEAVMHIFADEWIFVGTLNAYVIHNAYDI